MPSLDMGLTGMRFEAEKVFARGIVLASTGLFVTTEERTKVLTPCRPLTYLEVPHPIAQLLYDRQECGTSSSYHLDGPVPCAHRSVLLQPPRPGQCLLQVLRNLAGVDLYITP
jgi:hypothetical protein